MPNNYNINFSNIWQNLMPPNKRLTKYLAWGKVLVYPIQWLHSRFFIDYKDGSVASNWISATVYTKDSLVKYTNKSIYSCIQNHTSSNTITPLNTEYWYKTQDNFIGLTERLQYTSQIILFEYALNRWFGLTFVQPPSVNPIFIQNNIIDTNSFLVSSNDENSAYASSEGLNALQFVGATYASNFSYAFSICYPVGLPTTLGIADSVLRQQISTLADKLKVSGTTYNIISY
jgi:hypothetical protein